MFSDCIKLDGEFAQIKSALQNDFASQKKLAYYVSGLCAGADRTFTAAFASELIEDAHKPVILTGSDIEAANLCRRLCAEGVAAFFFPRREPVLYNIAASRTSEYERLKVLYAVISGRAQAIVTTPAALLSYTMPKSFLGGAFKEYRTGDSVDLDEFTSLLVSCGYSHTELVEGEGQFARRGGIVDVYPSFSTDETRSLPVRLEFFGDEIDRICYFDPDTQRVTENVGKLLVTPAREVICKPDTRQMLISVIKAQMKKAPDEAQKELLSELAALEGGLELDFADKYITLIYPERMSLADYTPSSPVFVFGTNAVNEALSAALWQNEELVKNLLETGAVNHKYADYMKTALDYEVFYSNRTVLHIDTFLPGTSRERAGGLFAIRCGAALSRFTTKTLSDEIAGYVKARYKILISCAGKTEALSCARLLREAGFAVSECIEGLPDFFALSEGVAYITTADKTAGESGFEMAGVRFVHISLGADGEVREGAFRRARKKQAADTRRILSFGDIEAGDYIVHESYGIGKYLGIETIRTMGVYKDYIAIQYAGTDRLLIPTAQLDLVSKYIGAHAQDGLVKLSKMGGTEWKKAKIKAKESVRILAQSLIDLYARRERMPGFAFPADDEYQREFEESFDFIETNSQMTAIDEIKSDMQKNVPMDRLLCGDVGYGKTEVALRAAFKAIEAGKQVALLCPTIILAWQHYQTALSRFRNFPVKVEMLSRFRSPKQQAEIVRRLRRGDIDLIIGTHKLVYNKLEFRDLGLLIIDEEQRFGVAQKEKLKSFANNIDVLSLSATPIPRTLNMALSGIRDMSLLEDAPEDRQPVQTYVLEHDEMIINDAIRRELSRGGQVFYLYNNIENINSVAGRIASAIPEARIAVAHGQMDKEETEKIWQSLVMGEVDILVCTTIIETGVDVPNANTLIIENSDRFGLSQLHQLRGRVGRSPRKAYAYFTFRRGKVLSEIATKRLDAIREYTRFGAGFRIAMRDLEIRGAGNLLGAEQHGHMDSVGYDLYIKLLAEAVLEEKGENKKAPKKECQIDIAADAYIPEDYVRSQSQRIELYKRIALITNEEDRRDMEDELLDRYGDCPLSVSNLLSIAKLKSGAERCGIDKISQQDNYIRFYQEPLNRDVWLPMFLEEAKYALTISTSGKPCATVKIPKGKGVIETALEIIDLYAKNS